MSGTDPRGRGTAPSGPRPAALTALAVIVALEAVGLAAYAVFTAVTVLAPGSGSTAVFGVAVSVTVLIVAVCLAFVARGLLASRSWTRSATLVWQLIQILVGSYSFQPPGARPDLGTLLALPAIVALVLLFRASVREATSRR